MTCRPSGGDGNQTFELRKVSPEFYVDQFRVTTTPYGMTLTYGLTPPHPNPGQTQAKDLVRVRMSLEHAKVMLMIMKKQVRAFEDEAGAPINIPRKVFQGLNLSPEDW